MKTKIIICDLNKDFIKEIKAANLTSEYVDIEVVCADILKVKKKNPKARIVTASNPSFSPDGGLDAILAKNFDWSEAREFKLTDDLFFVRSVDETRKATDSIIFRALVGLFLHRHQGDFILPVLGCGIGAYAITKFIDYLSRVLISADLRYANLSYANLRSANLSSANLSYTNLSSADLSSANLSSADLSYANLSSADLHSANLSSADLRYANLSYANLRSANLRSANLRSADLRYADLRYADLSSANLSYTNLRYANLRYADLRYADLSSANLSSADLSYANLSSADLHSANLSSANLSYTNLSSADLSSANLSSANLSYTNLRSADLRSADLRSANLSSANLSSTEFDGLTVNQWIEKYSIKKKGSKLIVYKGVTSEFGSPTISSKYKYEVGAIIEDEFCSFSVQDQCKPGLHVCPTIEAAKKWGRKVIECQIDIGDIVAIPAQEEAKKIRVKKLKVIKIIT